MSPFRPCLWILVLLSLTACSTSPPKVWSFHYEAEKGDLTVSIPFSPAPLQTFREQLPRSSPDRFDRDTVITKASTRTIGTFRGHRVIEVSLEVKETYYTDLFMLVCEIEPEQFVPVYARQYRHHGSRPEVRDFQVSSGGASLKVTMDQYRQQADVDVVTFSKSRTGMIQVKTQRVPS